MAQSVQFGLRRSYAAHTQLNQAFTRNKLDQAEVAGAEIYNMLGQVLISTTGHKAIDVSRLPESSYLVRVRTSSGIKTGRFVKN